MKRRTGPGTPVLDSTDSAAQFIDSHNITVVGFFDVRLSILAIFLLINHKLPYYLLYSYFDLYLYQDLESEAAKLFKEAALDMTDTEFAVSASPEVFHKYEVKANSVVLFKKVKKCYDSR